jgi:hypothetical protein
MGDPRRAQLREHGGGNRRQAPPGLNRRISAKELLGQDTSADYSQNSYHRRIAKETLIDYARFMSRTTTTGSRGG